eukprot:4428342-Amphidinium_carterae.1
MKASACPFDMELGIQAITASVLCSGVFAQRRHVLERFGAASQCRIACDTHEGTVGRVPSNSSM